MAHTSRKLYQLKITLLDSKPPIWRRVLVGSDTTLDELHQIIQDAMGWYDTHMHAFTSDKGEHFGPPETNDDILSFKDESRARLDRLLRKPKKKLLYEYDFGDGWMHEILLEKQLPLIGNQDPVKCLGAVGACPPEDIGGVFGYERFLEVINNPDHPEHEDMADWYGADRFDPAAVDIEEINAALRGELEDTEDPESVLGHLTQFIAGQSFDSQEALQAAVQEFMETQQAQPIADFHGLSPNQVHQLLYSTFDYPELLQWSVSESHVEQTPIVRMAESLITRLQAGDIKLTTKGNLPLVEVKSMAAASGLVDMSKASFRSEDDVEPVAVTRLLIDACGLTQIQKGRLRLTKKGAGKLKKCGWLALYQDLLRIAFTRLDWSCADPGEQVPIAKIASPFMLWLLRIHGDTWQTEEFYYEAVIKAFPALLADITSTVESYSLRFAFSWQTVATLRWFGLIEYRTEPAKPGPPYTPPVRSLRATPLLREIVKQAN